MPDLPAILGGTPAFPEKIDIVRPNLPPIEEVQARFGEVLANGKITNNGRYVRAFERSLTERLGTPTAVMANGTLALTLLLRGLGRSGEIILPSFTFPATAHAAIWCGYRVRFADVNPETWTLDPESVKSVCSTETAAIVPVHIFGVTCDVDALVELALETRAPLVFDAAHAFGTSYNNRPVGSCGDAEVFSFHATKLFAIGEGGAVATENAEWLRAVRAGRNFGLNPDGDCEDPGTNAKMSDLFAIIGLSALENFSERLAGRRRIGHLLREKFGKIPGVTLQRIPENCVSNHQNFAILVDPDEFGLTRDELHAAMDAENVTTRKYFYPPLHEMSCYQRFAEGADLPETERIASRVLCFPIYSDMTDAEVDAMVGAVERNHADRKAVRARIGLGS